MNEPQPTQTEAQILKQPAVAPWLWITLIIVVIAAAGYFGWQYLAQNKTQTEPPVGTNTTATISTADWKTYNDSTYNFSFKYPGEWEKGTTSSNENIVFIASASSALAGNDFKASVINDGIDKVKSDRENKNTKLAYTKTTISTKTAYKSASLRGIEGNVQEVLIDINPKTILISSEGKTIADLDVILDTFKFTAAVSTADWKKYANSDYGFSFNYPSEWKTTSNIKEKAENWMVDIYVTDGKLESNSQERPNLDIAIFNKLTPDLNDSSDNKDLTTLKDYLEKAKYADGSLMYKNVAPATVAGKSGYSANLTVDLVAGKFYFIEMSDGKILYIIDYDNSTQSSAVIESLKFDSIT